MNTKFPVIYMAIVLLLSSIMMIEGNPAGSDSPKRSANPIHSSPTSLTGNQSPGLVQSRSPSPVRSRSPSPVSNRSSSPVHDRSSSPVLSRPSSPASDVPSENVKDRSTSPQEHLSTTTKGKKRSRSPEMANPSDGPSSPRRSEPLIRSDHYPFNRYPAHYARMRELLSGKRQRSEYFTDRRMKGDHAKKYTSMSISSNSPQEHLSSAAKGKTRSRSPEVKNRSDGPSSPKRSKPTNDSDDHSFHPAIIHHSHRDHLRNYYGRQKQINKDHMYLRTKLGRAKKFASVKDTGGSSKTEKTE